MATQVQNRRGTTAEHSTFTGAVGEVTIDTDKDTVVVHDGSTAGGRALLREDGTNSALALGSAGTPSLKFTGDTNTGIYSPGADQVAISTNGTGRLTIDSSGNVNIDSGTVYVDAANNRLGVGTISPAQVLDVQGGANRTPIAFKGNASGTGYLYADNTSFGIKTSAGSLTGTDAFVGVDTANTILFLTSGAEKARFDSSGRLGIGSSTPGALLHIEGGDAILKSEYSASGTTDALLYLSNRDGGNWRNGYIGLTGAGNITFANGGTGTDPTVAGTAKVTLDTSGRLGIGSTSPSTTLSIGSSATGGYNGGVLLNRGASVYNFYEASDGTNTVIFGLDNTLSNAKIGSINSYPIGFYTGNVERARIDTSGRLLVGTSSALSGGEPSNALFQVQGRNGGAGEEARIAFARGEAATSITSNEPIGTIYFCDNGGNTFADIRCSADGTAGTNDYPGKLVFSTTADGASSPTERMRIQNDGKVFIGTTSVSGSSYGANLVLSKNSGTTRWEVGPYNTATAFIITADTTNGVYLSSTSATSWSSASDERIKTDLEPITDGLAKVGSLRAVTGRFVSDKEEPRKAFLIAQDVLEVLPEAVDISNPERYGLAYTEVIPLLVAALKESKERIEQLEAKVAALESA